MSDGCRIVCDALLGKDAAIVRLLGKNYFIKPPTIRTIAGVGSCLSGLGEARTVSGLLRDFASMECLSRALSWLIRGDESLAEELSGADFGEAVAALETGLGMISAGSFTKLSALTRSVSALTARPR